jgi:hypothetical protein
VRDGVIEERHGAEREAENGQEQENWQEQALNFLRSPETLTVLSNILFASALFMALCGSIHNAMQALAACSRVKRREPKARAERDQERERESVS